MNRAAALKPAWEPGLEKAMDSAPLSFPNRLRRRQHTTSRPPAHNRPSNGKNQPLMFQIES